MSVHQKWLESLKAFPGNLLLPPPSMITLGHEFVEIKPGEKLVAKIPFQKKFANPVGVFQGGILTACIDDVFGPLSYMTAGAPCLTLSLNTTYLASFTEEMGHCIIEAVVIKKTKNFIFMRADVKSPTGDLLAHAETHVKVLT